MKRGGGYACKIGSLRGASPACAVVWKPLEAVSGFSCTVGVWGVYLVTNRIRTISITALVTLGALAPAIFSYAENSTA